jgi:ribosomal-protein-alanine N-acetyltransferase
MSKAEPLRLRAAHTSEAREIASISRQQVEYGLNWRWTPARVKRYVADPESMVLVVSRGGIMQGFAIMKFADDAAHLLLLAVQPNARREGVGTALLKWLEKSCDTAGIAQVRLEVRASNDMAKQFYASLGYRLVGRMNAYYDSQEAAVVMEKSLAVC